jgi:predicted acetyltransferase
LTIERDSNIFTVMNLKENIDRIRKILNLLKESDENEKLSIVRSELGDQNYNFLINGEEVGKMKGDKEGETYWVSLITIYPKWRGKGMGEKFIIQYLKDNGGSIGSKSLLRNRNATKMWERIIKRNDIDSEVDEIYSEYQNGVIPTFRVWKK